jgi:hypothetical protein
MKLAKSFELGQRRDVWNAMRDARLVAECLQRIVGRGLP